MMIKDISIRFIMRLFGSGGNSVTRSRLGPANHHFKKDHTMKSSTKDSAKGVFHQLAGKARVIVAKVIKSPGLEAEGNGEIVAGKIQGKTGRVKKVLEK
jgi:uncharacterized protein YjbJ (UPF0337 family)